LNKNILGTPSISIFVVVVLLITVTIFWGSHLPVKLVDFSVNWSAGSLLLEGKNPYNPDQMLIKEQTTGLNVVNDNMMQYWYPPWSLSLSILVGAISYPTSQIVWLLLSIGAICFCASTLWHLYRGGQQSQWFAWFLALTFTPALYALIFGQFNWVVLLGITGFLIYIRRGSPKADLFAGLLLGLCAIKPTLLYLLWLALLLWSFSEHRYRVLVGLALAIGGGTLISMIFRPGILLDYLQFAETAAVTNWKIPTIGYWIRNFGGLHYVFLQYIPILIGLIWLVIHWILHRKQWDWLKQISWLSFMSLITTVFAWSHDQIILIPAVTEAAILIRSQVKSIPIKIIILIAWLAFMIFIFIAHLARDDSWFVWQAPAILLVYALSKHYCSANIAEDNSDLLLD
jgi:hypothetical protein